jgi:hypothetical protein
MRERARLATARGSKSFYFATRFFPRDVAEAAWRPWYGSWRRALRAPLAIYLFQGIVTSAMFASLTGRGAIWKGRRV